MPKTGSGRDYVHVEGSRLFAPAATLVVRALFGRRGSRPPGELGEQSLEPLAGYSGPALSDTELTQTSVHQAVPAGTRQEANRRFSVEKHHLVPAGTPPVQRFLPT